ncbi:unnamed protein product [Camellia sinensis]
MDGGSLAASTNNVSTSNENPIMELQGHRKPSLPASLLRSHTSPQAPPSGTHRNSSTRGQGKKIEQKFGVFKFPHCATSWFRRRHLVHVE